MLTPLVVLLSGYGICPTPALGPARNQMLPYARSILDRMQESWGERPTMLVTCFGLANWRLKSQLETEIGTGRAQSSTIPELFEKIRRLADTPKGKRDLIVMGHSYGGWMAMNVVLHLKEHRTRFLATIDPISVRLCKPQRFGWETLRWAVGRVAENGSCTRNPRDMEPYYDELSKRADNWVNVYQSQTGFLHSSAIPEAHENVPRDYARVRNPAGAHGAITSDEVVWDGLEDSLIGTLAQAQ